MILTRTAQELGAGTSADVKPWSGEVDLRDGIRGYGPATVLALLMTLTTGHVALAQTPDDEGYDTFLPVEARAFGDGPEWLPDDASYGEESRPAPFFVDGTQTPTPGPARRDSGT